MRNPHGRQSSDGLIALLPDQAWLSFRALPAHTSKQAVLTCPYSCAIKKITDFLRYLRLRLLLKEFLNFALCDASYFPLVSLKLDHTLRALQEVQRERRTLQE